MANAATLRAGTARGPVGGVEEGIHSNCAATQQRRGQHNYIADWITERAGDHLALASDAKGSDRIGIHPPMAAAHGAWTCAQGPSHPDANASGCRQVKASLAAASCASARYARSGCRVGFCSDKRCRCFSQMSLQVRVPCYCGSPACRIFEW